MPTAKKKPLSLSAQKTRDADAARQKLVARLTADSGLPPALVQAIVLVRERLGDRAKIARPLPEIGPHIWVDEPMEARSRGVYVVARARGAGVSFFASRAHDLQTTGVDIVALVWRHNLNGKSDLEARGWLALSEFASDAARQMLHAPNWRPLAELARAS